MPIYVYVCPECAAEEEVLLPMRSLDSPHLCQCGAPMVRKPVISTFKLEGTGWYATDYKDKP
jgi:putative FmdB family regulatory protein